jgi:DNA-binding PadR family transcriptional regulator
MGANVRGDKRSLAMRSSVNWAVLGLLIERPGHGYDLFQRFDDTYAGAIELSTPSQIYGALNALERRSLIEQLPATDAASEAPRQPKPHYRATPKGLRAYEDFMMTYSPRSADAPGVFARMVAGFDPVKALAVVERYEQACLDELKSVPLGTGPDPTTDDKDRLAAQLVREEKCLAVGAKIAWARYARSQLKALAAGPG